MNLYNVFAKGRKDLNKKIIFNAKNVYILIISAVLEFKITREIQQIVHFVFSENKLFFAKF